MARSALLAAALLQASLSELNMYVSVSCEDLGGSCAAGVKPLLMARVWSSQRAWVSAGLCTVSYGDGAYEEQPLQPTDAISHTVAGEWRHR